MNEHGLFDDLDIARTVRSAFFDADASWPLEIIWASTGREGPVPYDAVLLGWDVACDGPFWSIVADLPVTSLGDEVAAMLNSAGLLGTESEAARYRERYLAQERGDYDRDPLDLMEWAVYRLRERA